MWTRFMDMHSGGGCKLGYEYIYIEAPINEAKIIFYNKLGRNPERVTCTCCGEDYSISENESFGQLTAYDRGCQSIKKIDKVIEGLDWKYIEENEYIPNGYENNGRTWGKYQTIEEYKNRDDVLIIYNKDIKDEERKGEVPQEGYVWMD